MKEEKTWEEVEQIIFDIKKRREEMRKKRVLTSIENGIISELANAIAAEIDKEILKRLTELGD